MTILPVIAHVGYDPWDAAAIAAYAAVRDAIKSMLKDG